MISLNDGNEGVLNLKKGFSARTYEQVTYRNVPRWRDHTVVVVVAAAAAAAQSLRDSDPWLTLTVENL